MNPFESYCYFSVLTGDGTISVEDMQVTLRQLAGSSMTDEDLDKLTAKVFAAAKVGNKGMKLPEFTVALDGVNIALNVDVPSDD